MLEIICPSCRAGNDPINQFCGQCGGRLQRNALVPRDSGGSHITIGKTRLPVQQVKQVGVSLAVSLATLLAEATLAWARRRLDERLNRPSAGLSLVRRGKAEEILPPAPVVDSSPPTVTVIHERIVEVHRWGRPVQRFIERMAWKREG
ncbi:MAG: zinc ribbon domain-containing protein [Anaerolineales bacterium]|nr:zinc ribbon domain-containing protein [Anaerolineales bacterium]